MRVDALAESPPGPQRASERSSDVKIRVRAGVISLVVGVVLLGVKLVAYFLTGSQAILSDALESIVNIVAALFAVAALVFAGRPADLSHPYGHGKVEFLSGGFEGGLIAFAALLIIYEAAITLWSGFELRAIETGVVLVAAAGAGNAVLGMFLVRIGRRVHSLTLEADGLHVLSDFWTSVAVIVGLLLVRTTGWQILDPLLAIGVGVNLAWTGASLLRRAAGGLLDESDPQLLGSLAGAIGEIQSPGIIGVHRLRAIRSGGVANIDAHLVVPRFWSVSDGHDAANRFSEDVVHRVDRDAEFVFHVDPCRAAYCWGCLVEPCPVRSHPFRELPNHSIDGLVGGPPKD